MVKRDFTRRAKDELWVADISYVPSKERFVYLAVVLDAYSRKVVGWTMADHLLRAELVLGALNMALRRRQPVPGLIHHSDRGSQYTCMRFGEKLEEVGVLPSMGSAADCFDNALMESFFATLKCELVHRLEVSLGAGRKRGGRSSSTLSASTTPSGGIHRSGT